MTRRKRNPPSEARILAARENGRRGGSRSSAAKTAAARENGRLGGRRSTRKKTAAVRANGRLGGRPKEVLDLEGIRERMRASEPITARQAAIHLADAHGAAAADWCRKMAGEQPDYADWWREVVAALPPAEPTTTQTPKGPTE